MKKLFKSKMNDNGSTFLFVVVAIMFIALLATLILALTSSGFKMKTVDYNSKQNFYETEEYSGKIYAEIGMNALGILGESYTTVMGNIKSGSIGNESELNRSIKELFYKQMLVYLRIANNDATAELYVTNQKNTGLPIKLDATDGAVTGRLMPLLKNMLNDPVDPLAPPAEPSPIVTDLEIKGAVVCDLEGATDAEGNKFPTITINDVHINAVDTNTLFETNLTFDIVVRYPEWDFTYMTLSSTGLDIDTYIDYVLISSKGITFDGVTELIYGCVGTGTNSIVADNDSDSKGIRIKNGADVKFYQSGGLNGHYKYEPLEVVAVDNIVIESSVNNSSSLQIKDGDVWCNSIILDKESSEEIEANSNGSTFTSTGSYLYIQDDLQLDGDYSNAQVSGGSYIGYSNNTRDDINNVQHSNSAIIINGNNSKVNLSGLNKLYVNGLAYIDYINRNTPYRTGESLSVKGNQDIYMVPDACMGASFSNPVSAARGMSEDDEEVMANNLLNNFFGGSYLDPAKPFVKKNYFLNNKTYTFYYLNFSSASAQTEYVVKILSPYTGTDDIRNTMIERVQKNLAEMNMSAETFLSAEAGTVYTAGALVTATGSGGSNKGKSSATFSNTTDALVERLSHINRFRLMKTLLMSTVGNEDVVEDFNDVPAQMFSVKCAEDPTNYPLPTGAIENYLLNRSMVDNFIDISRLDTYVSPNSSWSRTHSDGTLTYVRVADGDTYNIGNYTGVVVVEGNVRVTGNVTGLVISTGTITVTGSGTLVADDRIVDGILTAEQAIAITSTDGPRSDVFRAYPLTLPPGSGFGESLKQLQYSDVLYYDNWRSYEDTNTYSY